MAETIRNGKSVKLKAQALITAKTFTNVRGFVGLAANSASSGEDVVLDIDQAEYRLTVPAGVTGAVGQYLYITSAGVITNTATGNTKFFKITEGVDANNRVSGILLAQN